MPRVTVDDMVRAIRDAEKPLTASDIADETGVTQQAISKRRDELESDSRVEYGQVANARAYWVTDEPEDDTPENDRNRGRERIDDEPTADVRRGRRQAPEGIVRREQRDSDGESQAESNTWVAGLASRSIVVRAAVVICVGYMHLIPAHFAAANGFGTVALGLLILTTVFAVGGLLLLFASVIANATLAITAGGDTDTRFADGGAET